MVAGPDDRTEAGIRGNAITAVGRSRDRLVAKAIAAVWALGSQCNGRMCDAP